MNVVHNAVKYSPHNGVLRISWMLASGRLRIAFQDEGPGIARDEQQRVFERFYTSSSSGDSLSKRRRTGAFHCQADHRPDRRNDRF